MRKDVYYMKNGKVKVKTKKKGSLTPVIIFTS